MTDEQRSGETRARAERALVRLLHELGGDEPFLVILGGLVPEVLTRDEQGVIPEHLGTTDVDVLLIPHVETDADLGAVERALERLEFKPEPSADGWRWRGPIDGWPVRIEFLCDLTDQREREIVRPRGCRHLAAANPRGTGYVARDFEWEQLSGPLADGTEVSVRVRFAGLEGYLLSKCVPPRRHRPAVIRRAGGAGGPGGRQSAPSSRRRRCGPALHRRARSLTRLERRSRQSACRRQDDGAFVLGAGSTMHHL